MLTTGHLLDNRYRLDENIATGGMGEVWRGTDVVLGRTVAVKVLRTAMLSDPEFAARFYGEARMLAAFRHPGVVEVYDYNSAAEGLADEQCAYLVMAFVDGEPLTTRLKDGNRLGVTETMSIVAQCAEALHAAHQHGTVHRDVKPGNLMVKPNGTIILVDFGVARSTSVTSVTGINSIVGTALYMAPEQVSKGDLSPATDIYALGTVAYQCLAGHPPFDGDNALYVALQHVEDEPPPLPADVPPQVRDLISRAMAKHPGDRFPSAAAFADAAMDASDAVTRSRTTWTQPGWYEETWADATRAGATALTAPLPPAPVPVPRRTPRAAPALPDTDAALRRRRWAVIALASVMFIALGMIVFAARPWDFGTPGSVPTAPAGEPAAVTPSASTEGRLTVDKPFVPSVGATTSAHPSTPTVPAQADPTPPSPPPTKATPSPSPSTSPSVQPGTNSTPSSSSPSASPPDSPPPGGTDFEASSGKPITTE